MMDESFTKLAIINLGLTVKKNNNQINLHTTQSSREYS